MMTIYFYDIHRSYIRQTEGAEYERESFLWGSSRGSKIRRELWLSPCDRDLLHDQPFDPLGYHPRHSRLAVCHLLRIVQIIGATRAKRFRAKWKPARVKKTRQSK